MSITLLRSLIAVAETGSFAAASARVNVSQAAVGQQMKRLEDSLGVALFDRDRKTPRLNPLGQSLIPKARDVVQAYDGLLDDLTGEAQLFGEMTLGAVPSTLRGLVPRAVKQLVAAYPGLRIRVVPGLSDDLSEQVERGALDAALLGPFASQRDTMMWQPVAGEPLVLISAPDIVGDDPKALLTTHPYIRHTRRAAAGRLADDWIVRQKLTVTIAMEMETLEAVASMVAHGLGLSVVPDICVPDPTFSSLRKLPLAGAPTRELGLLTRTDCPKRRLTDRLLEEVASVVATPTLPS
ncbi:LysR family transcriptional regulator [uncultured Litoreibacter sp.]|uniref:LysR family transcriptional regulator n=1 Tax=uncultured Litoreibacter sp. TaxID=1392394 RepID=UPI002633A071|nr:LysR family transcriptional regulator [uncultured Litoreibacter sp.]